ncbi:MAG: hypothetical protein V3V25_02280 [Paracoccaceae bacterium]
MKFIRPEISEAISRFRDAIAGVAVSLLGLYWALGSVGSMQILGTSMAVAGALLVFAGIQRGRFRTGAGGSGVVLVDEGQVTYYGPVEGGSVVISDLDKVELDPNDDSASEWVLHDPSTLPLRIPTDAEGAEALFDVFSGLEGLKTEKLLAAIENVQNRQVVIWQSNRAA